MARDTTDDTPISSVDELAAYLASGCKPKDKPGASAPSTRSSRSSPRTIQPGALRGRPVDPRATGRHAARRSVGRRSWTTTASSGFTSRPAWARSRWNPAASSNCPARRWRSIHQTCRESNAHLAQLRQIADPLGIKFLGLGASPKWTLTETPRMPKVALRHHARLHAEGRHVKAST
jgi:glutamate--cysteine ligase